MRSVADGQRVDPPPSVRFAGVFASDLAGFCVGIRLMALLAQHT